MHRRTFIKTALLAAGLVLGGRVAYSARTPIIKSGAKLKWRMVTSWPAGAPGTGQTATRLARRITELADQELSVEVYAAGQLVGAFEVFDAVARGTAEMGHSASFFWTGKTSLASFWTAVPFGLNPAQHHSWLYQGGGQKLWDELYGNFGIQAFAAGNSGPSMGGWFKRPLGPKGLQGLKMRMPGLGGEVVRQLGALPVSVAPGDIFQSLHSGAIDAAEFLGPWQDRAFGLHKAANYYYYPGFHEPNGSAECLINGKAFRELPRHLQSLVAAACQAENLVGLSESDWHNALALQQLTQEEGIQLKVYPPVLLRSLKEASEQVLAQVGSGSDLARRIYTSYRKAQRLAATWSPVQSLSYE